MATRLDSTLSTYLNEIKRYPLLTAEEEVELGSKIQAAGAADGRLAQGEIAIKEHERIQRDAAEARNRMIHANLRLVISVAKNFRNRGLPMEDLIEDGNVGLMNAVDRFDPTVGSRFSTYASYWIDQAIRRAVQSASQMIHIPNYLMEQIGHMKLALRELETQLGRAPTNAEVAHYMSISVRKASAITQAIRACSCPNHAQTDENGVSITATLPDTRLPAPHDAVFSESDADFVSHMLARINDREARVLRMRYGINGKRMTLKQIGQEVGLTRERVRQIVNEAKRKLEEYVKEYM